MGDAAKTKRREQLKRWAGSCTDRTSDVPRRRWRGDPGDGGDGEGGEPEAELDDPQRDKPVFEGRNESSPGLRQRKRVRFDSTAEFLAACASGDTKEAHLVLEDAKETKRKNGEDVSEIIDCSNADGITALHQACIDGSMDMVTFLVEQGANVNQVDSEGWTALHVAASCGYPEIAEFLLQRSACLSAVNCDGDVPLDIALDETTESLLQDYTQKLGVDLETAKRQEEEQLMKDARTWLTDGLPADVRHPKTGATPLHVAAAKGYLEALKILCQCGLDVSAVDFDGWTPLHAAAHWGQGEACCILAEHLCNMEARSIGGQTPFDVADESVEGLLEELSKQQANWRNEQSILDRQNQTGSNAANAQNKRRRSSVCRMSSRDKMTVLDQSKERGVSGGLDLSEDKENSPENSTASSPDTESATTPTISPADKTPEEKAEEVVEEEKEQQQEEEKEQDKVNRTARVQPKYQAPHRDEESESQRKVRSRLLRQARRSTQGVTLSDFKEAVKAADSASRNIQAVSPIVTVTPAERDTDPVKEESEEEQEEQRGLRVRRRGRTERRSTGVIASGLGENEDEDADQDDTRRHSFGNKFSDASTDYRTLYFKVLQENLTLKDKLQELELQLSQNKVELERLRQNQESSTERPAMLELEKFEKLSLQRKAGDLEDELKILADLKADNQRLKDENAALIRVISKLSR
ncbi:protein phosphatase 1 regulatory subunit 12C isoform 2-T2 [Pholidichthys leucotaenia]